MKQLITDNLQLVKNKQIFATRKSAGTRQLSASAGSVVSCPRNRAFTLVEMTVSLGLFTIIMFIATNGLLSVINTDRKSRSVRIASDNLNIALEDISRRLKTGTSYYCDPGGEALLSVRDCATGSVFSTIFFTDQNGQRVMYTLDASTHAIMRSIGSEPPVRATSPEISVDRLDFIVAGSLACGSDTPCTGDNKQPIVIVGVTGNLGSGVASTTFRIQTTVTQRVYDN